MTNIQFIEEKPVCLVEVQGIMKNLEKRDPELNYRSVKTKDFLENFPPSLSAAKEKELYQKLVDLNLTRLKEEHIIKIIDFLPTSVNDLKAVLQAYPLSMPKKDQDAIVAVVKEFA
ncbi:hypothetical protein COV20_00170 [Candidatus Woesearchaeota archaeon CG10_big_fil_rev_8_21_14_0_10_45_16]|nr:MAG: hypothetical protein COV20_00170 [Candidatus Woesearchaeota archaeon CG10_big_fil_rev_8_21_14_0_10_45_16]